MKQNWIRLFPPGFNTGRLITHTVWFLLPLNRFDFFHKYINPLLHKHFLEYSANYMDYLKWEANPVLYQEQPKKSYKDQRTEAVAKFNWGEVDE
tara:strand:+ start:1951 stop:2232 length:282 start_codon:yes stop_codon:yes gene_type:complete